MARDLRLIGASIQRPDERTVFPPESRTGPYIGLAISSEDLKNRPVHILRLTEDETIRLIAQLSRGLAILRGVTP